MYKLEELNNSKVTELKEIAKKLNISNYEKLKKLDLAYAILDHQAEQNEVTKTPAKSNDNPNSNPSAKTRAKPSAKPSAKPKDKAPIKNENSKLDSKEVKITSKHISKDNNYKNKNQEKKHHHNKNNPNQKHNPNNRPNPNQKPKSDYDYDFDGIIEKEGCAMACRIKMIRRIIELQAINMNVLIIKN